jgi:hypothetical protein
MDGVTRLLVYLLLFGTVLYLLSLWGKRQTLGSEPVKMPVKPGRWLRSKIHPREVWVQVYEIASIDEARMLQARLEEEEIECILYEQGKKDIHGNEMVGIGIAVPKTAKGQAQRIISKMTS